jgi:hypothetical protein
MKVRLIKKKEIINGVECVVLVPDCPFKNYKIVRWYDDFTVEVQEV